MNNVGLFVIYIKNDFSDLVFCRTWFKVDVKKFYSPVTTLLLPLGQKNSWKGVKTTGEIKRENNIKTIPNKDNLYTVRCRLVIYLIYLIQLNVFLFLLNTLLD